MAGFGLSPVKHAKGGLVRTNNFVGSQGYRIATTAPTAFFEGDLVTLDAGNIVTDMAAASPGAVVGVFWGAEYQDNSTGEVKFVRSIPNGTVAKEKYKCYVYDDPDTIFKIQADQAGGAALTNADVGHVIQIVADPVGSAITHKSGLVADSSTVNTGNAGFPLSILGSAAADDTYTATGTTMDILVKINTHQYGLGGTGVAGI